MRDFVLALPETKLMIGQSEENHELQEICMFGTDTISGKKNVGVCLDMDLDMMIRLRDNLNRRIEEKIIDLT